MTSDLNYFRCFIGLWLAVNSSLWLLILGTISIFASYKYSAGKHSFSANGLGEIVAAIFLGTVVTTIAYVVHGYSLNVQDDRDSVRERLGEKAAVHFARSHVPFCLSHDLF